MQQVGGCGLTAIILIQGLIQNPSENGMAKPSTTFIATAPHGISIRSYAAL